MQLFPTLFSGFTFALQATIRLRTSKQQINRTAACSHVGRPLKGRLLLGKNWLRRTQQTWRQNSNLIPVLLRRQSFIGFCDRVSRALLFCFMAHQAAWKSSRLNNFYTFPLASKCVDITQHILSLLFFFANKTSCSSVCAFGFSGSMRQFIASLTSPFLSEMLLVSFSL